MDDFYSVYKSKNNIESEENDALFNIQSAFTELQSDLISNTESGFIINKKYIESIEKENGDEQNSTLTSQIFEWLGVFVAAVISVVIVFTLIFRVVTIKGSSMENTLFTADKVIITNLGYTPKCGDIVVISRNVYNSAKYNESSAVPIIKRVIAVAGQTVDIDFDNGIVYVDGVALEENYTKTPTNRKDDIVFPVRVPEGSIFVLGDNRNSSMDSRFSCIGNNGMVDIRYVLGHAIMRILPLNRLGRLN